MKKNIDITSDISKDKIEIKLKDLLEKNDLTLSIAESCTGGYISHLLTIISGISKYFKGSIIAYSNEVKIKILEIDPNIIKNKGVVSKEIAIEMAKQIRSKINTNIGIGVTGIAGPTGGTTKTPVGTIWIAVIYNNNIFTEKFNLIGTRKSNIEEASKKAISMIIKIISNFL